MTSPDAQARLKACAHCGGEGRGVKSGDKVHPYRVTCQKCGCGTPNHASIISAWQAWSTRTHDAQPSIFDLLEPLSKALVNAGGPDIRGGFARGTGGVDITYIVNALTPSSTDVERKVLDGIAEMMGEFVDNWPEPKRVKTALALIAKTMRAALDPPRHRYWGAGEADCPRDIKAGNGELHTLRCKVCGEDNPRSEGCRAAIAAQVTK